MVTDVERLARALFIHLCPPKAADYAALWDSGQAARQSWIDTARAVLTEMENDT